MQNCIVSVCRFDKNLRPGGKTPVIDGGDIYIIHSPDNSGSQFKVYKEKPASTTQKKSAESQSESTAVGVKSKRKRKQPFNASNRDGHVLKFLKERITVMKEGGKKSEDRKETGSISSGTQPSEPHSGTYHIFNLPRGGSSRLGT
jgi:hypothetical protein